MLWSYIKNIKNINEMKPPQRSSVFNKPASLWHAYVRSPTWSSHTHVYSYMHNILEAAIYMSAHLKQFSHTPKLWRVEGVQYDIAAKPHLGPHKPQNVKLWNMIIWKAC